MLKTLAKSVKGYIVETVLSPIFILFESIFECCIPLVIAELLNAVNNDGGLGTSDVMKNIGVYAGILIAMSLGSLACGILSGVFAAKASTGFAKNLRRELFKKTQEFSFTNIDSFSVSSLVTRMTTDIFYLKEAFQSLIRIVFRAPILMVVALVLSFIVNTTFGCIFLAAVVLLAAVAFLILYFAIPNFKQAFVRYDEINAELQENIKGIRVVKAYVREDYEGETFRKASYGLRSNFYRAEFIVSFNQPVVNFLLYSCMVAICAYGAYAIVSTNGVSMNVGNMQQLITYAMQVLMSVVMIAMVVVNLSMAAESAQRCYEVLRTESDIVNPENPIYEIKDGSVDFNNVYFKYSSKANKFALDDVNLHIPSGSSVGIFGPTGSSKTTLVNLICRLYDVTEGSVLVGGNDVREYDLKTLRDQVAVVLQKNVLFKGTIKENLRWGNEEATDEEIEEACKLACADEFIQNYKEKYDYMIEQGGTNVSGGQKQRLCIARALIKKPKILILDDSTSAVDTKTDKIIRDGFKSYIPSTTKFIIGQRISSIQECDMIIIMDDGKVNDVGTHEELLSRNKIYQEVFNSQTNLGGDEDAK